MTQTLLCILSDNLYPNFISICQVRPDSLVLVQTERMAKQNAAQRLVDALLLGGQDYRGRTTIATLGAGNDLSAVKEGLKRLAGHPQLSGVQWSINLTGGTKLMAIAAYDVFRESATSIYYIEIGKPGVMQEWVRGRDIEMQVRPTCAEFVKLAGLDLDAGTGWDPAWGDVARDMARGRRRILRFQQDVPMPAGFLPGGWLEEFMAATLHGYRAELGIWDVRRASKLFQPDNKDTLTDIDVAFMRDHALWAVECKVGLARTDEESAMTKIDAFAKALNQVKCQPAFVTVDRRVYQADRKTLAARIQQRRDVLKCRVFGPNDVKALADAPDQAAALKTLGRLWTQGSSV